MQAKEGITLPPSLAHRLTTFLKQPHHFLIISGARGSGKFTIAKSIAANLLGLDSAGQLDNYAYFIHLSRQADKKDISIDAVRDVIAKLKLSVPGKNALRRAVIVEDAHFLSEEAQNAILKTLEEPPGDTIIIFTTDGQTKLLPTIISRGHIIQALPISLDRAISFYKDRFSQDKIKNAWLLSEGRLGLIEAILENFDNHELKLAVDQAKQFLRMAEYARLVLSDQYSKNKEKLSLLLEGLDRVLAAAQRISLSKNPKTSQIKMLNSRKHIKELVEAVDANVSPKLVYLSLCLKLKI